ncbi:MAG: hypothetical protein KF773_24585 [Deltaproteobacteria bacterium]|nr:hypothetical protein [Deltaproteobacteria bacterium]MCW5808416.1 hypothetical protein [Deltaproteobacteria bacterium]
MRTLAPLLILFAAACGGDPPNVGGSCTATDGCDDDLTCNTTVPGGYCTTACTTPGSTSECPEDSVCDSVAGNLVSCVKICTTSADCRADLDCNGVSGNNIKACKPKP